MTASPARTCRYDHGVLELLHGRFSLVGVDRGPPGSATGLIGQFMPPKATGQLLVLHAWRCPICGYVELVDNQG